jgi:hypothetical protein
MIQHEPLTLVESPVPGVDPAISAADPVMGVWWADRSKGYLDRGVATPIQRYGMRAPHDKGELGKWVFTPEGRGVRLQHFTGNGPDSPDAALIDFFSTWDGRPWADPHGPAFPGQLVQHWRLDPCMVVRLVLDNVAPAERLEWTTYAISTDRSTLAVTSWDHATPGRHDLLVFNKHGGRDPGDSGSSLGSPAPRTTAAEPPASVLPTDPILGVWIAAAREPPLRAEQVVTLPGIAGRKLRFEREADGVREEHFGGAAATTPVTSFVYRFDGSEYPRPDTPAMTERVTSWKIDPYMVIRRLGTKNRRSNWSIYAIAVDGSSMVVTSWDEGTPYDQHIRVFTRQIGGG